MAEKMSVSEMLRLACIYAEQDREEMLRCLGNCDPKETAEIREFLAKLRAYRLKRWGKTALEGFIESADEVPVI